MQGPWKPIEDIDTENPIWILKYNIYFDATGNFCSSNTEGAKKFTSCHGWYENEADAQKVRAHFPNPNGYTLEKVYRRSLKN